MHPHEGWLPHDGEKESVGFSAGACSSILPLTVSLGKAHVGCDFRWGASDQPNQSVVPVQWRSSQRGIQRRSCGGSNNVSLLNSFFDGGNGLLIIQKLFAHFLKFHWGLFFPTINFVLNSAAQRRSRPTVILFPSFAKFAQVQVKEATGTLNVFQKSSLCLYWQAPNLVLLLVLVLNLLVRLLVVACPGRMLPSQRPTRNFYGSLRRSRVFLSWHGRKEQVLGMNVNQNFAEAPSCLIIKHCRHWLAKFIA